jgi:segregation and condensation protein A
VSSPLNIHLEHYEGPLDLLLDLIRKQQIDIKDIPIATITAQYLEYIDKAREMDMDLGSDFIYMAATLIHIKSKMLLPHDPALEKEGDALEDPRQELVDRLLEHERFKSAAEMLHQKRVIEEAVWSNPQIAEFRTEEGDPGLAVTLFDLVKTFQGVLERIKARPTYEINKEEVSVPDMIRYLHYVFEGSRGESVPARELFERQSSRRAMICLFLAMLELVKVQAIGLVQQEGFGEIGLKRLKGFETAFTTGEELAAIDEGYN